MIIANKTENEKNIKIIIPNLKNETLVAVDGFVLDFCVQSVDLIKRNLHIHLPNFMNLYFLHGIAELSPKSMA